MTDSGSKTVNETPHAGAPAGRSRTVPIAIGAGVVGLLAIGVGLFIHARGSTNKIALSTLPKPVTAMRAVASHYRENRRYVGTLEPWVAARIGPQLVSAYVDTVLVRPGAIVKRGQVLATLDCRNTDALSKAVAMQARAVEKTQKAVANEAARVGSLLDGGFASADEVEQKQAESESKAAQLLGLKAQLMGTDLQVADCVLRSPFDGEISDRQMDPGAFAKPGSSIVTVVDRGTIRLTADVPEDDFADVPDGTPVNVTVLATDQKLSAKVSRRAPAADPGTRTVHIEIDIPNRDRSIPVNTTAELYVDVGQPVPATELPLSAAALRGTKATVYLVDGEFARQKVFKMLGEHAGELFVDPSLKAGSLVVTEGWTALTNGDRVQAKVLTPEAESAPPPRENTIEPEAKR